MGSLCVPFGVLAVWTLEGVETKQPSRVGPSPRATDSQVGRHRLKMMIKSI